MAGIAAGRSWGAWWDHLEKATYSEIRAARQKAEEAAAEKARQHALQRAAARVRKNPDPPSQNLFSRLQQDR